MVTWTGLVIVDRLSDTVPLSQGLACMAVLSPHFIVSVAPLPCTPGISCENKSDWAKLASSTHFNNGYQMMGVCVYTQVGARVCVCM